MSADSAAVLRNALEAASRGDVAPLLDRLAPDVTYTVSGDTALSGVYRGREAVARDLLGRCAALLVAPPRLSIQRWLHAGDTLVIEAERQAELRTGARYRDRCCLIVRLAGGHVVEVTDFPDTAGLTRALAVPHTPQSLLQAMDLNCWEMYREGALHCTGAELVETGAHLMIWAPRGTVFHNALMVRGPCSAEQVDAAAEAFYLPRQAPHSVWLRAHADIDLEAALRARGYQTFVTLPGMALLADPGTRCEPAGLEIRAVCDDRGRNDFRDVSAAAYAVYGSPTEYAGDAFSGLESLCAPHIQGFIGYLHGRAVAAAATYVTHGVAGIGWVGCIPEARGHRYAEALTWAALREGLRRGGSFANLQASPMGRPVYARMGFATPTEYRILFKPAG